MIANIPSWPTLCLLICLAAPALAAIQPGVRIGTFDIARFAVEGNTLLNEAAVQSAVGDLPARCAFRRHDAPSAHWKRLTGKRASPWSR